MNSFGEARLDWMMHTDTYALRVFVRHSDGIKATVLAEVDEFGEPAFKDVDVPQGGVIPPLLTLPGGVVDSLRRQITDKTSVAELTRHRDDAVEVRDRLLSIIEKEHS